MRSDLNNRSSLIDGDDGVRKSLQQIARKQDISHGFGRERARRLLAFRGRSRHVNSASRTVDLKSMWEPAFCKGVEDEGVMDLGTSKRGVILITSGGDLTHGGSGVSLRI